MMARRTTEITPPDSRQLFCLKGGQVRLGNAFLDALSRLSFPSTCDSSIVMKALWHLLSVLRGWILTNSLRIRGCM